MSDGASEQNTGRTISQGRHKIMLVTTINGSPRAHGNTDAILSEALRAFSERNAEVRRYQLGNIAVGLCRGCKSCFSGDGKCVQTDDIQKVIADIIASDLVILASPSYWGDVTAQTKIFIDRCMPYCNTNPARRMPSHQTKGAAIAIRAGSRRAENEKLIGTFEHFLGHLDIPLVSNFTVERMDTVDDLRARPEVLTDAYRFGEKLFDMISAR